MCATSGLSYFFFFNDTATTEIYTLSLHDALPISEMISYLEKTYGVNQKHVEKEIMIVINGVDASVLGGDRKSTRLNSSHANISYAVFCLKKKKKIANMHVLKKIMTAITYPYNTSK